MLKSTASGGRMDIREIAGRPVVLYVDVPNGSPTDLVDLGKVKVVPR